MDLQKIREHWDNQARKFGTLPKASWGDLLLFKEIATVCGFIRHGGILLDAGCANGFSSLEIARLAPVVVHGVDYSWEMIIQAQKALAEKHPGLQKKVTFALGDVRRLPFARGNFDFVLSKRCITNLNTREAQENALREFHRLLKTGGVLLLSEPTHQGLACLNRVRLRFGLPELKPPWHNLYLDEDYMLEIIKSRYKLIRVVNFSSTYYLGSRVVYPLIVGNNENMIRNDAFINKCFLHLPNFGAYGVQKLFVLERI